MRKVPLIVISAMLAAGGAGAVRAATRSHPDSRTQSIADGCTRSQLGLLGEAEVTHGVGPHPTLAASWVYVNGDRRPKTVEGTVLGTYPAGSDLFGVHDTYDVDIDVQPAAGYEGLLSSRNVRLSPGQIQTEWESGLAPLFAWPRPGDRVRETGSEIWDCGHWQDGLRKIPDGDFVPGDPAGTAGFEPIGGEEIEIHPIMELATWRARDSFVPPGANAAVRASRIDVALSNQGGKAKGVEECALAGVNNPAAGARRFASGGCSKLQDITGRRYTYVLSAPGPKPTPTSRLRVASDIRYVHHGPALQRVKAIVQGDKVAITVPFTGVSPSKDVQDFGATWRVWWTESEPVSRFRVTLETVQINNNLGVDNPANANNPTNKPASAWNMYVDVANEWVNLHDPRPGHPDFVPGLGAVRSAKAAPVIMSASSAPPLDVSIQPGGALRVFADARECQQPGYVDCPTSEFGANGRSAGRAELSLPVDQLIGRSTKVTIHPPVCSGTGDCQDDRDPPSLCPAGCYDLVYRVDDVTSNPVVQHVDGDGTAEGSTVNGRPAAAASWWIRPLTRYGPDQGEENLMVARVLGELSRTKEAQNNSDGASTRGRL